MSSMPLAHVSGGLPADTGRALFDGRMPTAPGDLPSSTSRSRMFWCTLLGLTLSFVAVPALGLWGASVLTDQTAGGVDRLLGGGAPGAFGLPAVALAALCSNAMNDSGSLALQTLGVRVPRPAAAIVSAALGIPLVLWMHAADTTARFQNVLLFVGHWIPGFVAIVVVDWIARARARGGAAIDVGAEFDRPQSLWLPGVTFVGAFAAAVPFMDTGLYGGPVAGALHGADLSYYVAFLAALALYAPLRLRRRRLESAV
jgi:NCS1 family nucleobase:cation symporter-1